jgi:protein gp37
MGVRGYVGREFHQVEWDREALDQPVKWRGGHQVMVGNMFDLFHERVPFEFIGEVFEVMRATPRHRYLVLSKRTERMVEFAGTYGWAENAWAGTSVESRAVLGRIDDLRQIPTEKRFLSVEPLLEDLGQLNLEDIQWVVCGGESGENARPFKHDWARSLRDRCVEAGVAFYFKQRDRPKRRAPHSLPVLDGRTWVERPEGLPW